MVLVNNGILNSAITYGNLRKLRIKMRGEISPLDFKTGFYVNYEDKITFVRESLRLYFSLLFLKV